MPLIDHLKRSHAEMTAWRRDIHAHPETAFEETRHRAGRRREARVVRHRACIAASRRPGVVGTLCAPARARARSACARTWTRCTSTSKTRSRTVAARRTNARLRTRRPHRRCCSAPPSTSPRPKLRRHGAFHLPAGRGERGRRARDGRAGPVRKLPGESVYGMHNWPGMPVGKFGVRPGPDDGLVRHLRDRCHRARRARRDAAHGHRPDRRGARARAGAADHRRAARSIRSSPRS